ncbi:hypothetical protein [Flavisolibacter tropicus]|uniref:Uncharacterized protein n=1 Tax=Flavisolibacter tropicus TaxID=1492898 RepID=A0A172TW08_9BACT|nr:hypothetical protein [Flavisolibacter tropicus]ANE51172.1 hypothetical protein SY85_12330 [Flavisolibacter tropicus]
MNKSKHKYYLLKHRISSVFMMMALLWLTISIPYVYASQQAQKAVAKQQCQSQRDDGSSNPLTNTNEEKTESGVNTLSEYLHEAHIIEHGYTIIEKYEKCHAEDLYFAYHPELISPPPDAISA